MILYKKYLWFISSDDVFGNKNLTRRVGSSARLGSAGAFRPDLLSISTILLPTRKSGIRWDKYLSAAIFKEAVHSDDSQESLMLKPWIFNICGENSYGIYENKFLSISHMSYVGIKSVDNG